MRIYTKTGDAGETGLPGGHRVTKAHPRIEACGHVDELNAAIGVARSEESPGVIGAVLQRIQHELFDLGADLAASDAPGGAMRTCAQHVVRLEEDIDRFDDQLPPLRQFILPGGSPLAAQLHVARAVCRRAERAVVSLSQAADVPAETLRYLNRLSDLLFVLARAANHYEGASDVVWDSPGP